MIRIALVAVVFLMLSSVGSPSMGQAPTDTELAAKIQEIVKKTLEQPNAVGLSVAVGRGDAVIFAAGFGKADLEFSVPVDKDTMFRIGSVTKQFSAASVMKLVEAGEVSLDDTLEKALPDFPKTEKPITVRQILTHTSGIWSYTDDEKFMDREASLELTPTELIALFKDHALDFDPGTKWNYSNSAYYLVGSIIEQASGKSYARYVQEEMFTPLGLARTRYESNSEIIANRAQGYSRVNGKLANDKPIGAEVPGAAGSLLSTAADLVKWSIALVNGKVVSAKSYEQMTTEVVLPSGKGTKYGFGLQLDTWESHKRISHGGGIFGFTSQLTYLPEEKLTVAVISNCDSLSPAKVADSILRAALGVKEFVAADMEISGDEFKRFAGQYKFETIPLEISFFERDGKMWCIATGQKEARLLYQGKGEFRAEFDHTVRFVFPETKGDEPAEEFVLHQGGEVRAKRKKK